MTPTTASWLHEAPPEQIHADGLALRRPLIEDGAALVAAVNESLESLRPWMPWAQAPATLATIGEFLRTASDGWATGSQFQYLVRDPEGDGVIGACGLNSRRGAGVLEIGYWVHSGHQRRGLASCAARVLTTIALELRGVRSVEIHHDKANEISRRIPRRLGYRFVGEVADHVSAPGEIGIDCTWRAGKEAWLATAAPGR